MQRRLAAAACVAVLLFLLDGACSLSANSVQEALDPVPSPTNATTAVPPRLAGLLSFSINLRMRVRRQMRELTQFLNSKLHMRRVQLRRLRAVIAQQKNLVIAQGKLVDKAKLRQNRKQRQLRRQQRLLARETRLQGHLQSTFHNADANWNRTIADYNQQLLTAQESRKMTGEMLKRLSGPEHVSSVAKELEQISKRSDRSLNAFMNVALTASRSVGEHQRSEFTGLISTLRSQLRSHVIKLARKRKGAIVGRRKHLAKLLRSISVVGGRVLRFQTAVDQTTMDIADLKDIIMGHKNPVVPVVRRLKRLRLKESALLKYVKKEKGYFSSQMANLKTRLRVVQRFRLVSREQLHNPNDQVRLKLWAVTDIMPPPKYNWTSRTYEPDLAPELGAPRSARPINPFDLANSNCGSWRLDEKDGELFVIDSSKFAHDGKLHGMSNVRLSKNHRGVHGGLAFDGMDDYVDVGRLGNFGTSLNGFTVSAWVKTVDTHPALSSVLKVIDDGIGQVMGIDVNRRVGKPGSAGQQFTTDLTYESNNLLVYLRDTKSRMLAGHVFVPFLFNGQWHHIQWTVIDSANNNMVVYVDGKHMPFAASVEQGPTSFQPLQRNLFIGAGNSRGRAQGFFDGAIDDVRLFCKPEAKLYGRKCCVICKKGTKPCGSACIALNAKCTRKRGCACSLEDMKQPETPSIDEQLGANITHPINDFGGNKTGNLSDLPIRGSAVATSSGSAPKAATPSPDSEARKPSPTVQADTPASPSSSLNTTQSTNGTLAKQ